MEIISKHSCFFQEETLFRDAHRQRRIRHPNTYWWVSFRMIGPVVDSRLSQGRDNNLDNSRSMYNTGIRYPKMDWRLSFMIISPIANIKGLLSYLKFESSLPSEDSRYFLWIQCILLTKCLSIWYFSHTKFACPLTAPFLYLFSQSVIGSISKTNDYLYPSRRPFT